MNRDAHDAEWAAHREMDRSRIQRALDHLRYIPTMRSLPPRRLDPLLCPCTYTLGPVEHVPWCDMQ